MDATAGTGAAIASSPLVVSYDGAQPDSELLEWVTAGAVSGVVIFRENAPTERDLVAAIQRLRRAAPRRFHIMVDEEGGRVRRLPDSATSMASLRSYSGRDPQDVALEYAATAIRLTGLGIDTLLAPVVDLGGSESEWLRDRTFSDDPQRVAELARAVIPAIQEENVAACAKHFPGMRAVAADPHASKSYDATPPSEWEKTDAVPFRAAVTAGVRMVLVGHQHVMGFDPMRPACLSPLIVQVLLRERLGFAGLVLSDDLAMGAIAESVAIEDAVRDARAAGCNLILVCRSRELQRRAVAAWQQGNAGETA
jgi:beta-N-acetylhexosaminidase